MTGKQTVADIETDQEGVTIRKQVYTDGNNVKITLELISNYQQDVDVRLLEPVPAETEPTQIAFHPKTVPDDSLVREDTSFRVDLTLPAWDITEVIYGIKSVADAAEECAGTPKSQRYSTRMGNRYKILKTRLPG